MPTPLPMTMPQTAAPAGFWKSQGGEVVDDDIVNLLDLLVGGEAN